MRSFVGAVSIAVLVSGCHSVTSSPPRVQAAVPQQSSYFPPDADLNELLQTLVRHGDAKGIVLGLLEPDGTRRVITFGDAGTGARPLSAKTVFEIGSINKTFTSAILADMARRGEVSLHDPVSKYLPSRVKVPSRNGRQITLLDLATHTSGLPRVPTGYKIPDRSNPYANYEAKHLYEFLSSYELERDVGAEPVYSNLGAGLLGHALARAAGVETLGELIRQRISGPLKMDMTDYGRNAELGEWIAKGHNEKGEQVPYWDVAVLSGAGGLNSTVEDMLTYLEANVGAPQSALEAAMGEAHLPRRTLKNKEFSVGLGWQQRTRGGQTIVHHGGGTAGFQTYLAFDPATGAGVVILGNSAGFETRDDVVFQLLEGRKVAALPETAMGSYVGTYSLKPDLQLTVSIKDGKLYGKVGEQRKARLYAEGNDRFFLLDADVELRFSRENGAVISATVTKGLESLTGRRLAASLKG